LTGSNIPVSFGVKTTIDIPEDLYKKAKIRAIERGVTLKQIVLTSLSKELEETSRVAEAPVSYWANRQLLPEYEAAMKEGAFRPKPGDRDITDLISEDRDAR
jgi:hypothetical protein